MKSKKIKFISIITISILATACKDKPAETKAPKPVEIQATEKINDKLLNSMRKIIDQQGGQVEDAGRDALETLAEFDRQELIDLTIEESSEKVLEGGDKTRRLLEDINGISE